MDQNVLFLNALQLTALRQNALHLISLRLAYPHQNDLQLAAGLPKEALTLSPTVSGF